MVDGQHYTTYRILVVVLGGRVYRLGLSDWETLHLHNPQGIGRRAWSRAQLVIEHHAGMSYYDYCQERIFRPANIAVERN